MKIYNPSDSDIDNYLNTIKESLENDVGSILSVYSSIPSGFFAVPRLLFPEIDGLGSYLTGKPKSTTQNISSYFKIILSQIDERYAKYAVFITFVYRHGLLHQHAPKVFEYRRKDIGWSFSIANVNNPLDIQRNYHLVFSGHDLQLDMNVFYHDVVNSFEILRGKLKNEYRDTYIQSILRQTAPLNKTKILKIHKKSGFVSKHDFNFFNSKDI